MILGVVDFLLAGLRDNSGEPLALGKIYTYKPGTTTAKATYTDKAGATPETNPVILDAYGRKQIYASGSYKFVITDANDVAVATYDNLYFATNYATTEAELSALEALGSEIVIDSAITLTGNLTLSVPVRIVKGGSIVTDGNTLTLNGPLSAEASQIFTAASGEVVFGRNAVREIYPEWFGATGDGSTDDTTAVQVAVNAAAVSAGTARIPVYFRAGATYRVSNITVPKYSYLYSDGPRRSYAVLKANSTTAILSFSNSSDAFITVKGLLLDGNAGAAASGIDVQGAQISFIEDCGFVNSTVQIDLTGAPIWTYIRRCEFQQNSSSTVTEHIKLSGAAIATYIDECTFGGTAVTYCIRADSSWTGDTLHIAHSTFGPTVTDMIKIERTSSSGGNVHFFIRENRFDGAPSNSNINIGRYCYGTAQQNSITGHGAYGIVCDGQFCAFLDNFISQADVGIGITSNAQDCVIGIQKWGSLAVSGVRVTDAGLRTTNQVAPAGSVTEVVLSNSTTETDIASVTIPAGKLTKNGEVIITLRGVVHNTVGTNQGATIKAYWNGVAKLTDTLMASFATANYAQFEISFSVKADSSTAAQKLRYRNLYAIGAAGSVVQSANPGIGASNDTVDTSSGPIVVKLTATLSTASASLALATDGYSAEFH